MNSKLGCHWLREHPDQFDFPHIEAMQYRSIKPFKPLWDNRDACANLLAVLPKDSYILARDHGLSEQKEGMWSDPVGHGTYHANEWAMKVASGQYHLPVERTFFLGINEPDATNGDRNAIDLYTAAFLDRLRTHGLRGGGFNFSTGHPRTVDGTPNTQADYTVFERSHQAIVRGHHIGVLHIYGTGAVPCAPGHYDRLKACTWQDVEWVVGEFGVDEHVIGGGEHAGFHKYFNGRLDDYCGWLDTAIIGINDPRIHSYQVFTYDFSHPWDTFDTHPIRAALEGFDWRHMKQAQPPTPPVTPAQPPYVPAPSEALDPLLDGIVTATILNVRSGPGASYPIVRQLAQGEAVTMAAMADIGNGTWFAIAPGEWVKAEWIKRVDEPVVPPAPVAGDNWARSMAFVLEHEGGWADDPNDPGGATMKGITIGTYTRWREAHGQPKPTKDDLRNISDAEVEQIYREWYWLESGSDKLSWPLCLANMDTAVNAGAGRAAEMLRRSNGIFLAYMGHLIDWYTRIENFEHFGRAWIRRRADILLEASKP